MNDPTLVLRIVLCDHTTYYRPSPITGWYPYSYYTNLKQECDTLNEQSDGDFVLQWKAVRIGEPFE